MTTLEKMAVVAVAIIALTGWFLPVRTQVNLGATGGTTNFDNLKIGQSTATTSVDFGRMCMTVNKYDGTAVYWYVSTTGSLATTSVSCN